MISVYRCFLLVWLFVLISGSHRRGYGKSQKMIYKAHRSCKHKNYCTFCECGEYECRTTQCDRKILKCYSGFFTKEKKIKASPLIYDNGNTGIIKKYVPYWEKDCYDCTWRRVPKVVLKFNGTNVFFEDSVDYRSSPSRKKRASGMRATVGGSVTPARRALGGSPINGSVSQPPGSITAAEAASEEEADLVNYPCCQTVSTTFVPVTVEFKRRVYKVARLGNSFQIFTKKECKSHGVECTGGNTCVNDLDHPTFVIVEAAYGPIPLPIRWPRFCRCANVNRNR